MKTLFRAICGLGLILAISGCMTASQKKERSDRAANGERAFIYMEVYTMKNAWGSFFPDSRREAYAGFYRIKPKSTNIWLDTGHRDVSGPYFIEPGLHILQEIRIHLTRWRVEQGRPLSVVELKGGDVLYVGTFEHKEVHEGRKLGMKLIDRSDFQAARAKVAKDFPELAAKLKPRILKSPYIINE